ncbi:uncharacterized protein LOC128215770 [Mya arenaria]|uniref:uncharacterized protein LOC128215770 n=1 Tax=Mya arenaria TaxID=6604 RepID=UPI0022E470A0|nr:uncharacterized protein LOC128215770 [Mya arenaria]
MSDRVWRHIYERHLICPVCMDLLSNPRALPCMHTFCMDCLHEYITRVCHKGTEYGFDCPVCRAYTRPSLRGLHPYSWAENYPHNFVLRGIIDDLKRKSNASIHVETLNSITAEGVAPNIACSAHAERPVEFFCEDHDKYICSKCAACSHRKCDTVHCLESGSSLGLDVGEAKRNYIVCNSDMEGENNSKLSNDFVEHVSLKVSEVAIDNPDVQSLAIASHGHRSLARLSLEGACGTIATEVPASSNIVNEFAKAKSVYSAIAVIENRSENDGPDAINMSDVKQDEAKKSLKRLCGERSPRSTDDIPSPRAATNETAGTPRSNRSASLGNLNDILEEDEDIPVASYDANTQKSQLQLKGEYYIRTQKDKKICSVTGVDVLPDGRVLLADETNCNVKLFDQNGVLISWLDLPSEPWDVACIEEYEAAVTCPYTKTVHLMIVHVPLNSHKVIELDKRCFGIAYFKSEFYVALENEVRVIDYDGKTIHKIITDPSKRKLFSLSIQRSLFRAARYVAVDTNNLSGILHVSDMAKSCVTTLDRRGGVMSKLRLGESGTPLGVSTRDRGQLYVCQTPDKLVSINIGEHGNHIKTLLELDNVQGVSYNRALKQLWVTRKASNFVKVYSFKSDL